jgi:6-phosphogluconolactonase
VSTPRLLPWGSPGTLRVVDDVESAFATEVSAAFHSRPRPRFSLVCSGGPTAKACYEELAHVGRHRVDWELVDIYMGDERCVPADDPDANQRLVRESLVDRVGNVGSFHPMSCEVGPGPYEMLIKVAGELDLVHMGMGPDGHTASLFADGPELEAGPEELVLLTSDPTGWNPHPRMTLSFEAFSRARLMVFTVAGSDKRPAFDEIVKGGNLPAAQATAHEVLWLVDRAAAGNLAGS